jgi:hypothetical protein
MELEPGETLHRRDNALIAHPGFKGFRLAVVALTSSRLVFQTPELPPFFTLLRILRCLAYRYVDYWTFPELREPIELRLSEISGFQTWRPYLSGPPAVQLGEGVVSNLLTFNLIQPDSVLRQAPVDRDHRIEHFEAIDAAWRAARAAATLD